MGTGKPKPYLDIGGKPMLRHTVERLLAHGGVAPIQVVVHPGHQDDAALALNGLPVLAPIPGGADRQRSVRIGLEALAPYAPQQVLIHDAARPFLPTRVVKELVSVIAPGTGAIAALPVVDTLKRVSGARRIEDTVSRERLWRAQTPQAFLFADIIAAHRAVAAMDIVFTDDAAVAEAAGMTVRVVQGDRALFKITTPTDLARAEALMNAQQPLRPAIGTGYDVHRFGPGDQVRVCGVSIPHNAGLVGHSDADVGLHALVDAILGALADGDIGTHFPPSDPQWAGADSAIFLRHSLGLVQARGGQLGNIDLTLIGECPKFGPHRAAMRARLAELTELSPKRIGIKATTTEGLGFEGRHEGLAVQAAVLLMLPMEE
jgi:2-C-methyl-D-erythritol 4-phosphate cytidylyltransferase/2-C-methyl-D-erythritol 2,4-cyclodiphosphate synthase